MDRRRLITMLGAVAAGRLAKPTPAAAEELRFPPGFVWGTASSAYQVEGRADRPADSIWDAFCRQPGKIKDGSNGDIACDSYRRYPEDVALIAGGRAQGLPLFGQLAAHPADGQRPIGGARARLLQPAGGCAAPSRDRAVGLPLSLGLAAGAAGPRRLERAGHR
jgi:hypothetical protein